MSLSDTEYQVLQQNEQLKELLEQLIPILLINDKERKKLYKKEKSKKNGLVKDLVEDNQKVLNTLKHLTTNIQLTRYLGIEPDYLSELYKKSNELEKAYKTQIKNKRATSKAIINPILTQIFLVLKDQGLGQTKQIDFIYRFYSEHNYQNYGKSKNKDIINALRERIRKDQESVL